MEVLPKVKSKFLTSVLGIPVEQELKDKYAYFKEKHGIDMLEWTRILLRRELKGLETHIKKLEA